MFALSGSLCAQVFTFVPVALFGSLCFQAFTFVSQLGSWCPRFFGYLCTHFFAFASQAFVAQPGYAFFLKLLTVFQLLLSASASVRHGVFTSLGLISLHFLWCFTFVGLIFSHLSSRSCLYLCVSSVHLCPLCCATNFNDCLWFRWQLAIQNRLEQNRWSEF